MLFPWFLILLLTCLTATRSDQQFYDSSECSENSSFPGSRYTCKSHHKSCSTFLVYRANQKFNSISTISRLFNSNFTELLRVNNLSPSSSDKLESGIDVLVPVLCSCIDNFFQANFSYIVPRNTTLSEIACSVFEGLVKFNTLILENPAQENGTRIRLPLKCACPDNDEIMYLVTYPLVEGDGLDLLSIKFGIFPMDIWAANHLDPFPTVYPNTTVLIPLKNYPKINFIVPDSPPPTPGFLPTTTVKKPNSKLKKLYILVSVIGFCLLLASLVLWLWYGKTLRRRKVGTLLSFNTRSSPLSGSNLRSSPNSASSCLSPDLLVGIKYSLKKYSLEELRKATEDFSESNKIGDRTYKVLTENTSMMIKQMRYEDTQKLIDVHTKINHVNIVNILGVCYGENDLTNSYVAFELPSKGCLRNWLSNSASSLPWLRRIQIAFDVATALHYLHNCIFPSYAHMGVDSRNIFITKNWRAKMGSIRTDVVGELCDKGDVFGFGIVLLEVISGREDEFGGKMLKESIGFVGENDGEGNCFEKLRRFMDPSLKDDYSLAEALCLAVLAKACVEDDPLHRPSMDDVLKVIVRLI